MASVATAVERGLALAESGNLLSSFLNRIEAERNAQGELRVTESRCQCLNIVYLSRDHGKYRQKYRQNTGRKPAKLCKITEK